MYMGKLRCTCTCTCHNLELDLGEFTKCVKCSRDLPDFRRTNKYCVHVSEMCAQNTILSQTALHVHIMRFFLKPYPSACETKGHEWPKSIVLRRLHVHVQCTCTCSWLVHFIHVTWTSSTGAMYYCTCHSLVQWWPWTFRKNFSTTKDKFIKG